MNTCPFCQSTIKVNSAEVAPWVIFSCGTIMNTEDPKRVTRSVNCAFAQIEALEKEIAELRKALRGEIHPGGDYAS